jgi:hypothetical protein
VGSGDGEQTLLAAELGEQLAAMANHLPPFARQRQLGVVLGDRGRDDDLGPIGEVRRIVSERRVDPRRPQPLHI